MLYFLLIRTWGGVGGAIGEEKQHDHNWTNEAYHAHSLCICHFLRDFSFFDFFDALRHSSQANNRLVHQLSPPLELIGVVQREPVLLWSRAIIRSVDADHPLLTYSALICTRSPISFSPPHLLSQHAPTPAELTLPFAIPWCLLRRSWEGRPGSFTSSSQMLLIWSHFN